MWAAAVGRRGDLGLCHKLCDWGGVISRLSLLVSSLSPQGTGLEGI